jgi:hypothetical protein
MTVENDRDNSPLTTGEVKIAVRLFGVTLLEYHSLPFRFDVPITPCGCSPSKLCSTKVAGTCDVSYARVQGSHTILPHFLLPQSTAGCCEENNGRLRVEDVSVIDLEGLMIRAMSYVMSVTLSSNLHQCYRHKILTGRRERVSGLRRLECCTKADERDPDTIPFETDPPPRRLRHRE